MFNKRKIIVVMPDDLAGDVRCGLQEEGPAAATTAAAGA